MQFITITQNICFKNPVYGEGSLVKGCTYYSFGQFARETERHGIGQIRDKNNPDVVEFQPKHLGLPQGPRKILFMFSGGYGDAVMAGMILPAVMKKHDLVFHTCCAGDKWEYIFHPMGLGEKHVPFPPLRETLDEYDAVLTDITKFYVSEDGLKVSPVKQLMGGFEIKEADIKPTFNIPERYTVASRLPATRSKRLGLHLDSNGKVKSYPLNLHQSLLKALLTTTDMEIYLLGTTGYVEKGAGLPNVFDLRGKTNIYELAVLLKQMDLVLGMDSFIIHLSNLLEKPTGVLLSTTAPSYFECHRHVSCLSSRMHCAPCFAFLDTCPGDYSECKAFEHESITPEVIATFVQCCLNNSVKKPF